MKKYIVLLLIFPLFIAGAEQTLQVASPTEMARQLISVSLDEHEDSPIVCAQNGDDKVKAFIPIKHSRTFICNKYDHIINVNLCHLPFNLIKKNCGPTINCDLQTGSAHDNNGQLYEGSAIVLTHDNKFKPRPQSMSLSTSEIHFDQDNCYFIPITITLENLSDGTTFRRKLESKIKLFSLNPLGKKIIFKDIENQCSLLLSFYFSLKTSQ